MQFGQLHLVPALADFLTRHEQIRVDLLLLDRIVDLVDEGIDLALRIGPLADSSMVAIRVGDVRRVVCASPSLLGRVGVPDHPRILSGLPCIRLQNLSPTHAWRFREGGRDITVKVDGRLGCNQIAAAVAACAEGLGFGQFLSYQVQQLVSEKRVQKVLEAFEPEPLPVHLLYPGDRLVSTRLRALINSLKDSLRRSHAFG